MSFWGGGPLRLIMYLEFLYRSYKPTAMESTRLNLLSNTSPGV
jgi:hypothetical protein